MRLELVDLVAIVSVICFLWYVASHHNERIQEMEEKLRVLGGRLDSLCDEVWCLRHPVDDSRHISESEADPGKR
jgi:hypothetical protein